MRPLAPIGVGVGIIRVELDGLGVVGDGAIIVSLTIVGIAPVDASDGGRGHGSSLGSVRRCEGS